MKETHQPEPYPHKFDVSISISKFIDDYGREGVIAPAGKAEGKTVSLAGRIHNIRVAGPKLRFYDLHGEGKKVQIMAQLQ